MANIPLIEIFPGINDLPTESNSNEGCNGSAVVSRINSIATRLLYPTNYPLAYTEDYSRYLDTVNGSDTNDGLTEGTAYLTFDRAIKDFEGKNVGDAILYVRGTLTAPLDFRSITPTNFGDLNKNNLRLYPFPTNNDTWKIVTPQADENYYVNPTTFLVSSPAMGLIIDGCTFEAPYLMDFSGCNLWFSGCAFVGFEGNEGTPYVFSKGNFILQSCTAVNQGIAPAFRFHGRGCTATLSNFTSDSLYEFGNTFTVTERAVFTPSGNFGEDYPISINYTNGIENIVNYPLPDNLTITTDGASTLKSFTENSNYRYLTFDFPALATGNNKILFIPSTDIVIRLVRRSLLWGTGTLKLQLDGVDSGITGSVNGTGSIFTIDNLSGVPVTVEANQVISLNATLSVPIENLFLQLAYETA